MASRIEAALPTFPVAAADQSRVAFMPDTSWSVSGLPQADPGDNMKPQFRCRGDDYLDTSSAIHTFAFLVPT